MFVLHVQEELTHRNRETMTSERIGLLDGLRAFVAFFIALYHFLLYSSNGHALFPALSENQLAFKLIRDLVIVFFILSALVLPIHLDRCNYNMRLFFRFLIKRLTRIYLPFLIVVGCTIAVDMAFRLKNGLSLSLDLRQFISNITLSCEFTGEKWYNPIFWTLAIEIQFYLLIGLLFPLIRRYKTIAVALVCIAGCALMAVAYDFKYLYNYTHYFTAGFLLFFWQKQWLSTVHCLLLIASMMLIMGLTGIGDALWIVGATTLVILFVKQTPRFLARIGHLSFSFYLIHGLTGGHVLYFTDSWGNAFPIALLRILLAMVIAGIAAWIFYKLIERPSLQLSQKIRYKNN